MSNQYLIIAENITYKNNKLSCINIFDQFTAVKLPAEFVFDLVVICGPDWEPGEHQVSIKAKTNGSDVADVGDILVNVPHENFIYNALAPNLKISLGSGVKNITFVIYKNNKIVIERTYSISTLFVQMENQNNQPQVEGTEKQAEQVQS